MNAEELGQILLLELVSVSTLCSTEETAVLKVSESAKKSII
jgi:hypothetical protein